jgi:hypothetical protein
MRNPFSEFGRSFKSGVDRAYGVPELQRDLTALTDRVADISISDEAMTQEILDFLAKHPEQTKNSNFQTFLLRWTDKRPGMLKILSQRIGLK